MFLNRKYVFIYIIYIIFWYSKISPFGNQSWLLFVCWWFIVVAGFVVVGHLLVVERVVAGVCFLVAVWVVDWLLVFPGLLLCWRFVVLVVGWWLAGGYVGHWLCNWWFSARYLFSHRSIFGSNGLFSWAKSAASCLEEKGFWFTISRRMFKRFPARLGPFVCRFPAPIFGCIHRTTQPIHFIRCDKRTSICRV